MRASAISSTDVLFADSTQWEKRRCFLVTFCHRTKVTRSLERKLWLYSSCADSWPPSGSSRTPPPSDPDSRSPDDSRDSRDDESEPRSLRSTCFCHRVLIG